MRRIVAAMAIWCGVTAWAVQVGDTRAAVLAELGEPQNKMAAGPREFLNYPAGRVEITNGRVSEIRGSFTSPAAPASATDAPVTPTVAPAPAAPQSGATTPAAPASPTPVPAAPAGRAKTARWHTDVEWTKVQEGSFAQRMFEAIDDARKATKGGKKVSGSWWPF